MACLFRYQLAAKATRLADSAVACLLSSSLPSLPFVKNSLPSAPPREPSATPYRPAFLFFALTPAPRHCLSLPTKRRTSKFLFVTTTLDIPDKLLREAQAEASVNGLSLQDFVAGLLEDRLAVKHAPASAAWKEFYGSMRHLHGERAKIETLIEDEFEQVDATQWK